MLNQIEIMGRLAAAPELKSTASGVPVVSFTLAVDRDFKSHEGERQTDWIDCVAWRQTAEFIAKYFDKGSMMVLSGKMQTRNWEDKEGKKRKSTEVVAENVYFGDSKRARSEETAPSEAPSSDDISEDQPF